MPAQLSFIVYSLAWGAALGLMASGLSLYYSVSKVANFAHGEYVSLGVLVYLLLVAAAYHGWSNIVNVALFTPDKLWTLIPIFVVGGIVGALSFALVFWPLMRRGATPLQLMVASIGLMFVLRFLLYVVAGALGWLTLPSPQAQPILEWLDWCELTSIVLAVAAAVAMAVFMKRTMMGIAMRAVADNPELAEASGINSFKVQLVAWFIGAGLAAVGGALTFILTGPPGERPIVELGWMNLLPIFAAAVVGGLGSFYGTLIAGFILGIASNWAAAVLMNYGLDPSLSLAVPFGLTILVLLVAPEGLAGVDWRRLLARLARR